MAYAATYTSIAEVRLQCGLAVADVSDANITSFIQAAEAELDAFAGRSFMNETAVTEYLPAVPKDIMENSRTKFKTSFYPIQSITACKFLNADGSVNTTMGTLTAVQITAGTYYTSDYWVDPAIGQISLTSLEVPSTGNMKIQIGYTYGYATVPYYVNVITAKLAAVHALVYFLGGNYNYLSSYTIPEQSVNKGDLYVRGMSLAKQLSEETQKLIDAKIGRRVVTTVSSGTGVY